MIARYVRLTTAAHRAWQVTLCELRFGPFLLGKRVYEWRYVRCE